MATSWNVDYLGKELRELKNLQLTVLVGLGMDLEMDLSLRNEIRMKGRFWSIAVGCLSCVMNARENRQFCIR